MIRPDHVTAALDRLAARTGIEHGQLSSDLWTALRYLAELEEENAALRGDADTVEHVGSSLAALATRVLRGLDGGPGDALCAAVDGGEAAAAPAVGLGWVTPRPRSTATTYGEAS